MWPEDAKQIIILKLIVLWHQISKINYELPIFQNIYFEKEKRLFFNWQMRTLEKKSRFSTGFENQKSESALRWKKKKNKHVIDWVRATKLPSYTD